MYLDRDALRDAGASVDDVAAALRHLTYRENLGPYVPASAIEQQYLDNAEFAAVFSSDFIANLTSLDAYGQTRYDGDEVDRGIPPRTLFA